MSEKTDDLDRQAKYRIVAETGLDFRTVSKVLGGGSCQPATRKVIVAALRKMRLAKVAERVEGAA